MYYRNNTMIFTTYSVIVYNSNGFLGEFTTAKEAMEYIDACEA